MFDTFITWNMLATYGTLSMLVFVVVEFTKNLKFLKDIPTKYYSAAIAFVLIVLAQLQASTFKLWDIVLYALSAIVISLSANGLSDFNDKIIK